MSLGRHTTSTTFAASAPIAPVASAPVASAAAASAPAALAPPPLSPPLARAYSERAPAKQNSHEGFSCTPRGITFRGPAPRRASDGGALISMRTAPELARNGSELFSDGLDGSRCIQLKHTRDLARARWTLIRDSVRKNQRAARGAASQMSFESVVRAALKQRRRDLVRSKHRRQTVHISSSETQRDTFALHLDALRAEVAEEAGGASSDESVSGNGNDVEMGVGEVHANGLSLHEVLQNPTAHHFLKIFAEREFSQESLLFLDSVDELRAVPQRFAAGPGHIAQRDTGGKQVGGGQAHARNLTGSVEGTRYLQHRVRQVYNKFVRPGARLQVNLSSAVVERIEQQLRVLQVDAAANSSHFSDNFGESSDTGKFEQQPEHACPAISLGEIFDEAREEVFALVENDAFERFSHSPECAEMGEALQKDKAMQAERRAHKQLERRRQQQQHNWHTLKEAVRRTFSVSQANSEIGNGAGGAEAAAAAEPAPAAYHNHNTRKLKAVRSMMSRMQLRLKRQGHGHHRVSADKGAQSTPLPTRSLPRATQEPAITIDAHVDAGALLEAFVRAREAKHSTAPSASQHMASCDDANHSTDNADATTRGREVSSSQMKAQGKGGKGWKKSLQSLLGHSHGHMGNEGDNHDQGMPIRDGRTFVPSRAGHIQLSVPVVAPVRTVRTRAHVQEASTAFAHAPNIASPASRLNTTKLQL